MKRIRFIVAGLLLFLTGSVALADVTLETVTKSGGFKGIGAHDGITIARIQGLKMAESNTTKFTGAILSRLAGGDEKVTITRVDKGVIWEINAKDKSYTETAIEPFQPPASENQKEGKPRTRVTKSEVTVKKTGASETINGFPCEEYLVNWLMDIEDMETKRTMKNNMTMRLWTTPETAAIRKLQKEQESFSAAFMKKMGMKMSPAEMKKFGMDALAASGASQKEMNYEAGRLKNNMAKVKGFPIRTVVEWKTAGDDAPQAAAQDSADAGQATASIGKLFGGLKGAIGRTIGTEESQKPQAEGSALSSTTEVKSIQVDSIPSSSFEIPEGYVRK
jgi:hypothetical protein